jgi:hypothetical protein
VDAAITISAKLARCAREGLHTEFGLAAEQLAGLTEPAGERSFDVYREPLRRQAEAGALLKEIGGETPTPPQPIRISLTHRPVLLRTLKEQRRSYLERADDVEGDERRMAVELVRDISAAVNAIEAG